MTIQQFISKLQESCINTEVALLTDGDSCHIVAYDTTNLNITYL